MGDKKDKSKPVAACTPPVQRADFFATNCKSALLFPDSAPLADQAKSHECVTLKGTDYSKLDLQAVWAQVRMKEANDKPAMLIFFHGFYGYVTINADGTSAKPGWALTAFADPGKGASTPIGYEIDKSADVYAGSIITLVPEIALPVQFYSEVVKKDGEVVMKDGKPQMRTKRKAAIPGENATVQVGKLDGADAAAHETLVDECLRRLNGLKNTTCPAPALSKQIKSAGLKRLFLSGHSGGHAALYPGGKSTLIQNVPTDLILLDCFYADGVKQVQEFAAKAKGGIGMGADKSRIICAWNRGSYSDFKDPDSYSEPMAAMLKDKFKDQFTRVEGGAADAAKALEKFPVVAIRTSVGHMDIPSVFLKEVLKSAPK